MVHHMSLSKTLICIHVRTYMYVSVILSPCSDIILFLILQIPFFVRPGRHNSVDGSSTANETGIDVKDLKR